MDDRDWAILTMLENERSISKLSDKLFVSQPALTYRINKIEKFFGTQLLIRNNMGFHLTPQGDIAIKFAKKMVKELEQTREDMNTLEGKIQGTIYIGSTNAIAEYVLPDLLSKFLLQYPGVEVNVVTGFSTNLINLLSSGKIHIAFLREDIEWSPYKKLLSSEGVYLVSQSPIQFQDLPKTPKINYKTNQSLKLLIESWWIQHFKVAPRVMMEVDNAEICKKMIRAGLGYSILPELTIHSEKNLCCVPLVDKDKNPLLRHTWLYCTEEALNYIAVRTFLVFVTMSLNERQ